MRGFPVHKSLRMRVKIRETGTAASGARWNEGRVAGLRPRVLTVGGNLL